MSARACLILLLGFGFPLLASASPAPESVRPATFDADRHLDRNQVNCWVTNFGSFGWDATSGNPGFVYPRGSGKSVIFAAGLWLGAIRGTDTLVTVAEYSQEYSPGPMIGASSSNPSLAPFRVYKTARPIGDPTDSAHVDRTPAELLADPQLDPLLHDSWSAYMANAAPYGAPWKLYRLPSPVVPGDSVDVPGPEVFGDQMLWSVYNDADPLLHTNAAGGTAPLGIEVQQTAWAGYLPTFDRMVFLRFKFINKGGTTLHQTLVSLWCDPDLGDPTDDLVGCDISSRLGYAYNADNADAVYGSMPPAVGLVLFRGPIVGPDTLGMYSFQKFVNGGDPQSAVESYRAMAGLEPDGAPIIDPTTSQPTRYVASGDPVAGTGWLDANPSDRRMMLTLGPFTFGPGDTQDVIAGVIVGQGANRLASITSMRTVAAAAQEFVDHGVFDQTVPALATVVSAGAQDGRVQIVWLVSGTVQIERREEASDWHVVGTASDDGTGRIMWTDSDVRAGARYGYRVLSGGVVAGEVWVEVTNRLALAIARTSNPSLASLQASMTLPEDAPARLEVLDVSGRRVLTREISGRGSHVIDVGAGLRSGLYFLRLTQGAASAEARAVFLK